MAKNKVVYGDTTIMDITDTTAEASDVAAGEVFYDRGGIRTVGTGNYMDKVTDPVVNHILIVDANGQAIDSGVLITDKANVADLPGLATELIAGLVKLNPSESVTLNADGQLDVGGRLGAFSGTTGIFHSKDREPRAVGDFSFLITDAKGMNLDAPRDFAIVTGVNLTLTGSHAAGSTTYTVANNYANRIACAVLANGGYLSQSEAYSKENQIVPVTSVKIDGSDYTPDSSADDSTKPITITVATTANPTQAVTTLRVFGGITGGFCSEYIGQCVGGRVGASLVIGQRVYSTSNVNCIVSADTYNTGNGNAIFGRQHISRKNRWLIAGTGHDTTNGRSEAGTALGQYSDIESDTLVAVGNGTSHTARSNAFEVKADGRVKSSGTPTEADDLATKQYVDSAIGGGGLTFQTFGNADFTYQQELDPDTQEVINECVAYSTASGNAEEPKAVKYGRMVNLCGAFKNINARSSTGTFVMGKVPSGCEPLYRQCVLAQGTSQAKFLLTIETDGTLKCARYSTGASAIAVPNNAWLNLNCTYVAAT
ncbi:MAG: hypothetical protein IJI87_00650 [Mogibacterium sp.]|nr:hypothetical protein [Mogibacterium sp.]